MKSRAAGVDKSLTIDQQRILSWYNRVMGTLRLSLLGSFEAMLGGHPVKKFRTRSVQALLIYLACHSKQALQRDYLLALLWPGLPQKSAQGNLRHTIYHLRQAIPEVSARQGNGVVPFIRADRQTVQINPEGQVDLDVNAFEALTGKGAAIGDVEAAVALYRGEFLADFHLANNAIFGEWTLARRAEYQHRMMSILGRLTKYHTEANNLDKAEGYARRQISLDDLGEPAHRQLMRILFLSGQRSAALTQYDICMQRLQDDLDIEPEAETRLLFESIRDGNLDQAVTGEAGAGVRERRTMASQDKASHQVAHNLPQVRTPFIGRGEDLSALVALVTDVDTRLVTIVGPGGIGKTRFALAAAERLLSERSSFFPDGIFFVPLRSLESSDLITSAIADALRFRMEYGDNPLLAYLESKKILLVLDNFEHVLDGAELVFEILQADAQVKILVTSRERLQMHGEQLYPIQGLATPEAGSEAMVTQSEAGLMFIQTARRMNPDFTLSDEDVGQLLRICRLVEGMPLALELAAGWTDRVGLADIAQEIEENLDFLEAAWRNVPSSHRSIRAVFEGSWGQLEAKEQSLFTQLSIFRGGFSRQAATEIIGTSLGELAQLINKSLLRFDKEQNLYSVHELLRQYGKKKLEEDPAMEADLRGRHSRYYNDWLSRQFQPEHMKRVGQKAALEAVQAELENARAAWIWALRHDRLARMIPALESIGRYYQWLGGAREGQRTFQVILDLLAEETKEINVEWSVLKAMGLGWYSRFTSISDSRFQAAASLAECLKMLNSLADTSVDIKRQQALCHLQLSYNDWSVPDKVRQQRSSQSLALYKEIDDPYGCSDALIAMARTARNQGHVAEAQGYIEESMVYQQASGNQLGLAGSLNMAGLCYLMVNRYDEAEALLRQSLELAQEYDHLELIKLGFGYLGQEYLITGRFEDAQRMLAQCLKHAAESGTIEFHSGWLNRMGFVYLHRGQYEEATSCGRRAQELVRGYGDSEYKAISITLCASVDLVRARYDDARQKIEEATPHFSGVLNTIYGDDGLLAVLGIALHHLGHTKEASRQIKKALQTATSDQRQVNLMYALAGAAFLFAESGEVERALELYALASRYPFVGDSRWFEDVVGKIITEKGQSLPAKVRDEAKERGGQLDLWGTARELSRELPA